MAAASFAAHRIASHHIHAEPANERSDNYNNGTGRRSIDRSMLSMTANKQASVVRCCWTLQQAIEATIIVSYCRRPCKETTTQTSVGGESSTGGPHNASTISQKSRRLDSCTASMDPVPTYIGLMTKEFRTFRNGVCFGCLYGCECWTRGASEGGRTFTGYNKTVSVGCLCSYSGDLR